MKKRIISFILAVLMFASCTALAADYHVFENARKIHDSVYFEPYQESPFATRYSPWLRHFHLMKQTQLDRGEMGGEGCQMILHLAVSPVNPDVMYMGSDCNALYKTENGGKFWFNTNYNNPGHHFWGILCDKFDENIVYTYSRKVGVARSRDGGKTWEQIRKDPLASGEKFTSTRFAQDDAGNTYFPTTQGIFRLDRATDELTNLYPSLENVSPKKDKAGMFAHDIDVSGDGKDIYVSVVGWGEEAKAGLYISHDAGNTWSIKASDEKSTCKVLTTVIDPRDENIIYTCFDRKNNETGETEPYAIYVSKDKGETFEYLYSHIAPATKLATGVRNLLFGPMNDDGVYPLYYRSVQSHLGMKVSYDYGKTWEHVFTTKDGLGYDTSRNPTRFRPDDGEPGWTYNAFTVCPVTGDVLIYIATAVHRKDIKTGKFTKLNAGYSGVAMVDIAFDSQDRMFLNTVDSGSWITESGVYRDGEYPRLIANVDDYFVRSVFDPNDDNHIVSFIGHANGSAKEFGIRQSYDAGRSFEDMNPDTAIPRAQAMNTSVLCYDIYDNNIIYSSEHTSYDNGKTWQKNDKFILAILAENTHVQIARKGTGAATELYYTSDGGKTWEFIIKPGHSDFESSDFDSSGKQMWFAGKGKLCVLDLEKKTIENHAGKLPYGSLHMVRTNPTVPGHILLTTSPGSQSYPMELDAKLYESIDGGETWHAVPGLWGSQLDAIVFSRTTDEVFLGTHSGTHIYEYRKFWEFLESKITVMLNNKEIDYFTMPVVKDGTIMVPVRDFADELGGNVFYNAENGEITISRGTSYAILKAGESTAMVNSKEYQLVQSAYVNEKGVTMVPLEFAAKALGVGCGWDEDMKTVYINK